MAKQHTVDNIASEQERELLTGEFRATLRWLRKKDGSTVIQILQRVQERGIDKMEWVTAPIVFEK
jgi:hypothetical protein